MKTIEERAKKFADEFATGDAALIVDIIHKVAEESYIKGATEQQEIDSVINEEELDRLALEHSEPIDKIPDDWFNKRRVKLLVRSAYEASYRKAKGE